MTEKHGVMETAPKILETVRVGQRPSRRESRKVGRPLDMPNIWTRTFCPEAWRDRLSLLSLPGRLGCSASIPRSTPEPVFGGQYNHTMDPERATRKQEVPVTPFSRNAPKRGGLGGRKSKPQFIILEFLEVST